MRCRAIFLALVGVLAGCTTHPASSPAPSTAEGKPAADTTALGPPVTAFIGHVISVDGRTLTAVVDISTFAKLPLSLEGQMLLTRGDDLTITGQVRASAYQRGHTLGVRLLAGRPMVGDEVVLPPTPSP